MYRSRVVRLTLYKLLKRRGLSPYAVAKRAGLSFGTVYRMCRKDGRFGRIEAETLDKLCAALDCTPGDLFERIT